MGLKTALRVAGRDDAGNVQGMLVLDHNNNGLIETADILHLGSSESERNSVPVLRSAATIEFASKMCMVDMDCRSALTASANDLA